MALCSIMSQLLPGLACLQHSDELHIKKGKGRKHTVTEIFFSGRQSHAGRPQGPEALAQIYLTYGLAEY